MVPDWASSAHNIVTFGEGWNGGTGVERRGRERRTPMDQDFDYILCDLSHSNVRKNSWRQEDVTVHFRQIWNKG